MRRYSLALLMLSWASGGAARGDELSAADKLRVVYSTQFSWTHDNLPIVPVRVSAGRVEAILSSTSGEVHVLPDGEGGAEVSGGRSWTVRLVGPAEPARIRYHLVVGDGMPGSDKLRALTSEWRERGYAVRTFEVGSVFSVHGEVLDSRRVRVTIDPHDDRASADLAAKALAKKFGITPELHAELTERPHGLLEARDERGTVVRNEGILWFAPTADGTLELKDVENERGGHENRRYFGKLYVTVDSAGKLTVVNAVPEDRLLAGLVPAEMSASAPLEALKAQAVAARNELLAKIGTRHLTDPFRLCSTQHCQVYAGAGLEDPRSTQAVQATRGEFLVRESGALVDAVYSASCGGHGEDNDLAWGSVKDPSLRGSLDAEGENAKRLSPFTKIDESNLPAWLDAPLLPFCAKPKIGRANYRWQVNLDLLALEKLHQLGPIQKFDVLERGVSGRVVRLRIVGERGTKEVRGELEVRRALGGLKSALITIHAERNPSGRLQLAIVRGAGFGHGIGMCQTGAIGMAEVAKSYVDILRHYYPGSHLKHLY